MRKFVLGLLIVVSLILQLTVFNFIKVADVKPDLILIIVIFNALINGSRNGAVVGIAGGLMQDLLTGQYIGLNTLSKMTVGYIFGFVGRKLYKENIIIPIMSLFLGSVINDLIFYFMGSFVNLNISFFMAAYDKILPAAIYNSCLAPFIYGKFYASSTKGLLSRIEH